MAHVMDVVARGDVPCNARVVGLYVGCMYVCMYGQVLWVGLVGVDIGNLPSDQTPRLQSLCLSETKTPIRRTPNVEKAAQR